PLALSARKSILKKSIGRKSRLAGVLEARTKSGFPGSAEIPHLSGPPYVQGPCGPGPGLHLCQDRNPESEVFGIIQISFCGIARECRCPNPTPRYGQLLLEARTRFR